MKKDLGVLLGILRDENAKGSMGQRLQPADKVPARVPTLDGKSRAATPMLRARFAFAGRWTGALLGQTWLSASDMARVQKTRAHRQELTLRRENWARSPVAKLPLERLSLFAVDVDDGDATYLVWGAAGVEPRVITFCGGSEARYRDLATLVKTYVGAAVDLAGHATPATDGGSLRAYLEDDTRRLDTWVCGLEQWGQPIIARAAIAMARLVLPSLPPPMRVKAREVLDTAIAWAEDPTGELPESFSYVLNNARPVAPSVEGKIPFEAMHACIAAAGSATSYHLERPLVVYADEVKAVLGVVRKQRPADIAKALNAAGLKTPSGAVWRPESAGKALARLEDTLDHARANATATIEHVLTVLGKRSEPKLRGAVRAALQLPPLTRDRSRPPRWRMASTQAEAPRVGSRPPA